jgi:hypothetical protein
MLHSMQARIEEFSIIQIQVSKVYIYDNEGNVYVYVDLQYSYELVVFFMPIHFYEIDCCFWCSFE